MQHVGRFYLALLFIANVGRAQSSPVPSAPLQSVYMEYLEYEQRVHSASNNSELGDNARIDMAFKYNFNTDTSFRFRLDIDPYKFPDENKSSKFELRLYHRYETLEIQGDFDVNGDDNGRGATSFGPDNDSDDSWLALRLIPTLKLVFYPYNIGTEVGREFRTLDITRIYYIDGTPSFISNIPIEDEAVKMKTVPGFELQWSPDEHLCVTTAVGTVSFLYPAVKDFSIEQNAAAERWKNKEDRAYKLGLSYSDGKTTALAEYVHHNNAHLSGSLLEAAWSLQAQQLWSSWVFDFERTWTKAGTRPFRLARSKPWFEETSPFRPIYSDYYGDKQDWLGKLGAASMFRVGYKISEQTIPFISVKQLGQYFLYRERESAQMLRTGDERASHGGLNIASVGINHKVGGFTLRPEYEYMIAKNAVFGNRTDIRQDKILSTLNKKNTVLTLTTTYVY